MNTPETNAYISELLGKWYECAPYGEQVPDELPRLFAEFCQHHGQRDEDGMWDAFSNADPEDPILRLFECIFAEGAAFAINRLSDAVYDRDRDVLKLISLEPIGTLAIPENDPNPECKHQHVMHPDQRGRMLFAEGGGGGLDNPSTAHGRPLAETSGRTESELCDLCEGQGVLMALCFGQFTIIDCRRCSGKGKRPTARRSATATRNHEST